MSDYKQRLVDDILSLKLSSSAAVLVEGPKWCGKTTTCLQIAKSSIYMDEPTKREQNIGSSKFLVEMLSDRVSLELRWLGLPLPLRSSASHNHNPFDCINWFYIWGRAPRPPAAKPQILNMVKVAVQ